MDARSGESASAPASGRHTLGRARARTRACRPRRAAVSQAAENRPMTAIRRWPRGALAVLALFFLAGFASVRVHAASTDDYPSRPIKLVVPFAAGTQLDLAGRIVA